MPAAPDTHLLLRAFVAELARAGVREACTSPGSRSTPLVLALVRDGRLRCFSHIDERASAFFAVGAAKAAGRPVAIACTSGTAAANYAPAVVEAHEAGVPLLVLTADRPPELRETGAGQAIDQVKLFGDAVRWFFEVGTHDATPERVRWMRALACRALAATRGPGRPGPVHLNFALREPLVPPAELGEDPSPGRARGRPWLHVGTPPANPAAAAGALAPWLQGRRRGVLVAGRDEWRAPAAGALARFAEAAGWPLLADPLSGERRGAAAVSSYDLLLRDEAFGAAQHPDIVVRTGDLPTSQPLRRWLAGLHDVDQVAFAPSGVWHDPEGVLAAVLPGDPGPTLAAVRPAPADPAWAAAWRDADARARAAVDGVLDGPGLSEPAVARELGARLPGEATLFVASSMPVRDVESFFCSREDPPRVLAHRGANGIDGTVSAAFGAAAVADGPVVLLVGDVALAHDIGGLLAARRLGLALTIVVVNNDGGGIFEFLPVAGARDAFEEHVATPHGLDLAHAAALYGCAHERPATLDAFRVALDTGLASEGTTIVEVRTVRAANRDLHARIADAVSAAISPRGPAAAP